MHHPHQNRHSVTPSQQPQQPSQQQQMAQPPPPQQQGQGTPQAQGRDQTVLPGATTGGPPQLPPQMFTTAAQLLDLTDKKLVLVLRDGRKLIGVLRSWDQFANLVLQETTERIIVQNLYADIPRGVFLVRGENVLLLGEIDLDKDDYIPSHLQAAPVEEVFRLKKEEEKRRKGAEKKVGRRLGELGFEVEHSGEVLF